MGKKKDIGGSVDKKTVLWDANYGHKNIDYSRFSCDHHIPKLKITFLVKF